MKVIGERISILKKEKLLSIVILPTTDKKKLGLMFLWLMAWTVCGIVVLVNYFKMPDRNARIFIIVYLSFWAYFEFNIVRAFIWKRSGKEKLWIQNGILHYQREINRRGKIREFNLDLINDLKLLELNSTSLADTINQSFWVKGGERLEFQAQARAVRFGMQITDEEARILLKEITDFTIKTLREESTEQ
jgi:hypothetical protein